MRKNSAHIRGLHQDLKAVRVIVVSGVLPRALWPTSELPMSAHTTECIRPGSHCRCRERYRFFIHQHA